MPSGPIIIAPLSAVPAAGDGGACGIDAADVYRELDVAGVALDLALVGEAHRAALLAALRACQAGEGGAAASSGPDTSEPDTATPDIQRGNLKAMAMNMLLLRAMREQAAALRALGDMAAPPRCVPTDPTISQSLSELAAACAVTDPETRDQAYSNTALALSMGISRQAKALRLAAAADGPLEQALGGAQAHAYDACVALHALALCHVLKTPPQIERTLRALGLALKGLGRVADAVVSGLAVLAPDKGADAAVATRFPVSVTASPTAPLEAPPDAELAATAVAPGADGATAPGADGAVPSAAHAVFWQAFVDDIRRAQSNLDALQRLANAAAPCVRVRAGAANSVLV